MLYYLLSPEFQIVNTAGKPCTGYLEVYYHGTRDRYYCASDFDGTLHPFQVPLDSLGGNVVLADDSHAYDVYIYNRYGSLLMSRYNIHPSSGGSMGGVITSSDGSVTVTPTQDGWDLSVEDGKAATFRAAADSLSADGYFSFRKIEGDGDAIYLDNGQIKMDDGWYHFSATVKLTWNGSNVNDTSTVRLYSGATYDVIDFDYSYNHSDTVVLDGDIWIGAHSTHYISFGRNFSLGVTGMRQGMVAELVDCDLHSILGQGVGSTEYFAGNGIDISEEKVISVDTEVVATQADLEGKQDVLTAGSNITISDNVISATDTTYTAGTGIDITGTTISADTSVVATQNDLAGKQDTLTAGTGITIQNNVISATAAQQVQSNWNETDTADPSYIQNKPDLSIYAESANLATVASTGDYDDLVNKPSIPSFDSTQMAAINSGVNSTKVGNYDAHIADTDIHVTTSDKSTWNAKQDAISDLNTIRSGAQAGSTAVQPGDLATVAVTGSYNDLTNKPTIPAAQVQSDWSESDSSAVSYIKNKPSNLVQDASYVHTDENFTSAEKTKLAGIESGAEVNVQSDWNESDSSSDAYIQNKPTIPAAQVNSDWNSSSGVSEILNKPDLSVYATQSDLNGKQDTLTAGSNISISNNVISATDTTYSAGTGIDITGTTISNADPLPAHTSSESGKILKVDSNGDLEWGAESGGTVTDVQVNGTSVVSGGVADITITAQVNSDWNASSGVAEILNKPTEKTLAAGSNVTITEANDTVTISATNTTYTAGTGVDITSGVISADTSVLATQSDLSSKQDTLTAGTNISISNNVISATDTTYSAGTGLTLTGTTFSNADPLPAHTSSDEGKVLSVDSNGDTVWDTPAASQVNSDWNATSGVAEILNKPTEKTLVAGTNVTITESASSVTISSTDTTYTAGTGVDITSGVISADTSVLATQSDLSSKQDTLTAGSNITISNNVISAASQVQSDWTESDTSSAAYIDNKPDLVDIVAGPGIVVDNPDGNTLRVSQAYPTDETVLYNNSATVASCTLSETIFNFERIKVYSLNGINSLVAMEFECSGSGYLNCMIAGGNNQPVYRMIQITVDSIGTSLVATRSVGIFFNAFSGTPTYRFSSSADLQCINKVVGIHRIANN